MTSETKNYKEKLTIQIRNWIKMKKKIIKKKNKFRKVEPMLYYNYKNKLQKYLIRINSLKI